MNSNNSSAPSFSLFGWGIVFLIALLLIVAAAVTFHRAERHTISKKLPIAEVPDFSFTTQEGKMLTKADLTGKIWIADFIFTRCAGPCPLLTSRMIELASRLSKNHEVKLVSVTVDPTYDTSEVLARYASNIHADPTQWFFLTGPLSEINTFVKEGMKQPLAAEPEGMPAHSTRLMLVDRHGMIRGYYDGNNPEVVQQLLVDIGTLLREPS
ncbi:MAG: SCO family protein [Chthoniobacterales bacterium]